MKEIFSKPVWCRIILFFVAFAFYANSFQNDYALDDVLVITGNKYVKNGISGIPDILSHDSYYGATQKIAKATGGRYRPLSIVTFAIENDLLKNTAPIHHFFNVFLYALLCVLIYHFLVRHLFKENYLAAFWVAFLFAIHPVHTEVVANIKSRDEILSLLFIVLSLHFLLNYLKASRLLDSVLSLSSFGLALLSKENGVIFIVVIPITVYVFSERKSTDIVKLSVPYWIILTAYIFLRFSVNRLAEGVVDNVLNVPYLLASPVQKLATIFWVLGEYMKLMFYPSTLSYDYSYNQVKYVSFVNLQVIVSAIFYFILLVYGIRMAFKKNVIGYSIVFFLSALFVVSNLLINIGTPMAERFLFGSGLFFIIAFVKSMEHQLIAVKKLNFRYAVILLAIVTVVSFSKVYSRNKDWKNNLSLYSKDVQTSSGSTRALSFYAMTLVEISDTIIDSLRRSQTLREAIIYFNRAYEIYPGFATMYQDWGGAYYRLNKIDSSEWVWNRLKILKPDSRFIPYNDDLLGRYYYNQYSILSKEAQKRNDLAGMLSCYREAVNHYDKQPESWLWLGKLYQVNNKTDSAIISWNRCLQLQPENKEAAELIRNYSKL